MVEIKHGQNKKLASSSLLVDFFRKQPNLNGKLYVGYPILYTGGENIIIDAIWISQEKGIVVFDLIEGYTIEDREDIRDELYNKVESELKQYEVLNKRRKLLVSIEVITYAPACTNRNGFDLTATNDEELAEILNVEIKTWDEGNEDLLKKTISVIQSVIQIKAPIDRNYIKKENSKGALIKRLEDTIANLDNQQESAIIEYHDGLQRIRGLAGSGKTIVIALKAAYLHAINPDWNIVVTFNTRSLKNQFRELIELFCIQKMGRKPDESKIRIIQAWGSSYNTGVYYEFCRDNNIPYYNFKDAESGAFGSDKTAFEFACFKALSTVNKSSIEKKYDIILVDEAQDLNESFLNLSYLLLKGKNKKLIYAYDELQKLHEGSSLQNPRKIFGTNKETSDIILKKCYRNPRPALVTAHALGFGIYREDGLVQFFDQPKLWEDLGYRVKEGKLKGGNNVVLYRDDESTHKFLEQHQEVDEIINFNICKDADEQAIKIANDIEIQLKEEELLHRDIIVINPLALTTKREVAIIRSHLNKKGIKSHIAGDINSDEFFQPNSITFTGINRAKGNEVPLVYIINAQDCFAHPYFPSRGLRERRNILFTAITRSKAWVRVYGIGQFMKNLQKEFDKVKAKDFVLDFTYPTTTQINEMNLISRDISESEEQQIKTEVNSVFDTIKEIAEKIDSGLVTIYDYPAEMQELLKNYTK